MLKMPNLISVVTWRSSLAAAAALAATLLCSSAAKAAAPSIRYTFVYGQNYLYVKDIAAYYGMSVSYRSGSCEMKGGRTRISFTYDRRDGSVNGVGVNYLFPVVLLGSDPLVSQLDFNFVIDPVMRCYTVRKQMVRTIMLDPGHGGQDNGAAGVKYLEKDLTLQMAQKLKAVLQSCGYNVYLTRDRDRYLTLDERAARCRSVGADLFISIHCNAAGKKSITGIETYCLTPEGAPSTADKKPKKTAERGNQFNRNNYFLAYMIQANLLRATGAADRGVRHARFVVLKDAPCPAALVETGFMSNPNEEFSLARKEYQDRIVKGIADGINAYSKSITGRR